MTFSPRDTKDVSGLVAKKLEWYLNVERREQRFDTQGYYRTTPNMQTIDLMYQMLDSTEIDKPSSPRQSKQERKKEGKSPTRKSKSKSKNKAEKYKTLDTSKESDSRSAKSGSNKDSKEKKKPIHPGLTENSRRVVGYKEAERLTENANKIFEGQPLDKLQVIHRYRPHSSDIPPIVENGRVQNYNCHVGSALHAKNYVDYYMKEGLQTGKKEYSKRLQRLSAKKRDTDGSDKGSRQGDGKSRSPSRSDKKVVKSSRTSRMHQILSPQSWSAHHPSPGPHPAISFSSIHSKSSASSNCSSHDYTKVPCTTPRSSRGSGSKHSSAGSKGKGSELYMVIGADPMRAQIPNGEFRAEVASSEDYARFMSIEDALTELERDGGGSFELKVDEESNESHSHGYVPFRPSRAAEEDSIDARARTQTDSTPPDNETEEEEEEEEEEETVEDDETEDVEEEQSLTEDYTSSQSTLTPTTSFSQTQNTGSLSQKTASVTQKTGSLIICTQNSQHTPRSSYTPRSCHTPHSSRTPRTPNTPSSPSLSQAALSQVKVIITRDGTENGRQVKLVKHQNSEENEPPNGTREAVVYVTEEEKAALDARANGEKPSMEDERAEDETDDGENRAEGNVRCYSGQEEYISKEQNLTLETSTFTALMQGGDNDQVIHSTPRGDGEHAGQPGSGGGVNSQQAPVDQAGGEQTNQQENSGDHVPTQQDDGDQGQDGGDEADGNGSDSNNDNGGGDGGEEDKGGDRAESSLPAGKAEEEAAAQQPPQEEENKAEGGDNKERVSSAGPNRANELEGLDIERGEDEIPDPETARGKLPEEFRVIAKPERGDEGIVKKIPPPPSREPSATSRQGGKYRAYNDDDRGLEKEYFLGDPTIKEDYHTSDLPTDDTQSELESRPSTRPSSACSQSSKVTEASEETATTEKTGISEKTGVSEKTGASEKTDAAEKTDASEKEKKKRKKKKRSSSRSSKGSKKEDEESRPARPATPVKSSTDGRGEMSLEEPTEESIQLPETKPEGQPVEPPPSDVEATPRKRERAGSQEQPNIIISARLDPASSFSPGSKHEPVLYKPPRPCSAGSSRGSLSFMQKSPAGSGYQVTRDYIRGEDDDVARIAPYSLQKTFPDGEDPDVHFPKLGRSVSLISQANTDTANPIYSTRSYDTNYSTSKRYSADVSESAVGTVVGSDVYSSKQEAGVENGVASHSRASSICSQSSAHQPIIKHPPSFASPSHSARIMSPKLTPRSRPSSRESQVSLTKHEELPSIPKAGVVSREPSETDQHDVKSESIRVIGGSDAERPPSPARVSRHSAGSAPRHGSSSSLKERHHSRSSASSAKDVSGREERRASRRRSSSSSARSVFSSKSVDSQTPHPGTLPSQRPASAEVVIDVSTLQRESPVDARHPGSASSSRRSPVPPLQLNMPSTGESYKMVEPPSYPPSPASSYKSYGEHFGTTYTVPSPGADRPPSSASQRSDRRAKKSSRPSSAVSKTSERSRDVNDQPSVAPGPDSSKRKASQDSMKQASDQEMPKSRTASVSSQRCVEGRTAQVDTNQEARPPSQQEIVQVKSRSGSASSQKSQGKQERDPSGTVDQVVKSRSGSTSSQRSLTKQQDSVLQNGQADQPRPPSVSSQRSLRLETTDIDGAGQTTLATATCEPSARRPPSAASNRSVGRTEAVTAGETDVAQIEKQTEEVKDEGRELQGTADRPASVSSRTSANEAPVCEEPLTEQRDVEAESNKDQIEEGKQPVSSEKQADKERSPSVSSQVETKERPPSVSSQKTVEKERAGSVSSTKQAEEERPSSVSSQKQTEQDRPPSASSKIEPVADRPPSAASERRTDQERPPSVSSQKGKEADRPPSSASQRPAEERPSSASSQKPGEAERASSSASQRKGRPPSVSSQKDAEADRPSSSTSQRLLEQERVSSPQQGEPESPSSSAYQRQAEQERPSSVSSQQQVETDRPPSSASQQPERPSSSDSQRQAEQERPTSASGPKIENQEPSADIQIEIPEEKQTSKEAQDIIVSQDTQQSGHLVDSSARDGNLTQEIPPIAPGEKPAGAERPTSAGSQKQDRPSSPGSQTAVQSEKPASVSGQKDEEEETPSASRPKQEESGRPPSVSSLESVASDRPDALKQKAPSRTASAASVQSTEKESPASVTKTSTDRPPSVASQKEEAIERPSSGSSLKDAGKERPPSSSSLKQEDGGRPASASSPVQPLPEKEASVESSKDTEPSGLEDQAERPASATRESLSEERPPSSASGKNILQETPPSEDTKMETEQTLASQEQEKDRSSVSSEKQERPPSVPSQDRLSERPASAGSQKKETASSTPEQVAQTSKPPSPTVSRPPSAGSQKQDRPPSASSQKQDRPPSASSQKQDRPPSASSQKQDRPPLASSQKQDRPPSASSQKQDRPPSASSQKQDKPPSAGSQKQDRPPSAASQREDRSGPVSSQKEESSPSADNQTERPPSATGSQGEVEQGRPASAASQKHEEQPQTQSSVGDAAVQEVFTGAATSEQLDGEKLVGATTPEQAKSSRPSSAAGKTEHEQVIQEPVASEPPTAGERPASAGSQRSLQTQGQTASTGDRPASAGSHKTEEKSEPSPAPPETPDERQDKETIAQDSSPPPAAESPATESSPSVQQKVAAEEGETPRLTLPAPDKLTQADETPRDDQPLKPPVFPEQVEFSTEIEPQAVATEGGASVQAAPATGPPVPGAVGSAVDDSQAQNGEAASLQSEGDKVKSSQTSEQPAAAPATAEPQVTVPEPSEQPAAVPGTPVAGVGSDAPQEQTSAPEVPEKETAPGTAQQVPASTEVPAKEPETQAPAQLASESEKPPTEEQKIPANAGDPSKPASTETKTSPPPKKPGSAKGKKYESTDTSSIDTSDLSSDSDDD